MYRFLLRPIWLVFHVVVATAIVAMILLGFWQLDRLDERKDFNAQVIARSEQAPIPIDEVLDAIDDGTLTADEAEWLPVEARGSYVPEQIVEFNQSQGGRAGENVLTALLLDGESSTDRTIIVNRGFITLGSPLPEAPATAVAVTGLIRTSEVRSTGGLTDADDGPVVEVRRIDVPRIAPQFPPEVSPVYLQLVTADPAPGLGDPEPVVRPELSNGPHLSYAVQWFVFATCVAIGWVLAVRRSVRSRRRASEDDDESTSVITDEAVERAPAGRH